MRQEEHFQVKLEAFLISISHIPLLSVGFNCALGADQLKPISKNHTIPHLIFLHILMQDYLMPLENTTKHQSKCRCLLKYLDDNLINIIGCCGTTPEHIKLIADIAKDYKPEVLVWCYRILLYLVKV
jgi:5-methyltetrahydrofolate--homocysteine methyltransferase